MEACFLLQVFHQRAGVIARSFKRNYYRQRYLRMKRGFTRLQAVVRGRKYESIFFFFFFPLFSTSQKKQLTAFSSEPAPSLPVMFVLSSKFRAFFAWDWQNMSVPDSFFDLICSSSIETCLQERDLLRLQGNVQKYQTIRTYTFQEIVQTEESYVKDLDTLLNVRCPPTSHSCSRPSSCPFGAQFAFFFCLPFVFLLSSFPQVFLKPMKAVMEAAGHSHQHEKSTANDPNPASLEIVVTTFNSVAEIRTLHADFSLKLKEKMEHWNEKTEIGGIFLDLVRNALLQSSLFSSFLIFPFAL